MVYERLFGKSVAANAQQAESYRNLLDYVLDDAQQLRKRLGRDDQFKLDEYLDAVRAVEQRIEYHTQAGRRAAATAVECAPAVQPAGVPADFREHIDLLLDLLVLAFRTDSTRISTFMFANDVSGRNFSFLEGVRGGHHELSHHENKAEKYEQFSRINRWHVEQFAKLLRKLQAIREGESTLLDNSLLMLGSSFSDGNRHDPDNLPILFGGPSRRADRVGPSFGVPRRDAALQSVRLDACQAGRRRRPVRRQHGAAAKPRRIDTGVWKSCIIATSPARG